MKADEVFAEVRKCRDEQQEGELHIHGHRVTIRREGLSASPRELLLITRYGWFYSKIYKDSAGDMVDASFEKTEAYTLASAYDSPRLCVEQANKWFSEGPAQMTELLATAVAEEGAKPCPK